MTYVAPFNSLALGPRENSEHLLFSRLASSTTTNPSHHAVSRQQWLIA